MSIGLRLTMADLTNSMGAVQLTTTLPKTNDFTHFSCTKFL